MREPCEIHITDAEWELMESVWQADDQTAGDVLSRVVAGHRSHRTLRTLLARLVEKGAVSVRVEGSRHLYSAAVSRESCVRSAAQSFAARFFDGNLQSLLMHFVEHESLSEEDAKDLRERLAAREAKKVSKRSRPVKKSK
ncbi:Beta-lactamase repressor BlaI [Rhodopirellula islandica]|uniref:Beta-lactamase repressor BlaI n=1 Tax=Rhodopirellula islandica TaxID=595434 RepID=A0A0J1EBW3_RHOIS|nr:BlaI/MecI/CopY family transcriptional regulator [Rhodopirellula islandica]KLU03034.1 Beta-lactamase repressor BlaI [Rhodopirellula islandica]